MRTAINLATRPFVPLRQFVLTAGLLAVLALGSTAVVGVEAVRTWRERTATQARVRELTAERARLAAEQQRLESELQDPATQVLLGRTRFLNQLIRQNNLSWTQLFFDLQERLPPRVRILSLAPKLREDGSLLVELEVGGESAPAVIAFLRALEEGEKFHEVALHSQDRSTGTDSEAVTARVSVIYVQE